MRRETLWSHLLWFFAAFQRKHTHTHAHLGQSSSATVVPSMTCGCVIVVVVTHCSAFTKQVGKPVSRVLEKLFLQQATLVAAGNVCQLALKVQ